MIITFNDLQDIKKKHSSQRLVLTSGTFDLLHVGHLNYLERVKEHGDIVVVLLSGDNRVKARKGSKRPIINESERAIILDSELPRTKVRGFLVSPCWVGHADAQCTV